MSAKSPGVIPPLSWRRLRLDDLFALAAVLFFLLINFMTSVQAFGPESRNFMILLLYYFLLAGVAGGVERLKALGPGLARLLLLGLLFCLFALTILLPDDPIGLSQIKNFVVLAFPVAAVLFTPRSRADGDFLRRGVAIARDWGPYIFSVALYLGLHNVVHQINPVDRDQMLIQWEMTLFGGHASVWLEGIAQPWLTEWLSVNYSLYVFFPLTLGMLLTLRGDRRHFLHLLQAAILTSYLGYIGYLIVPAIGPIYTLADLYAAPLDGGSLFHANKAVMEGLRIPRDCFPSLHTAHTLVVLLIAFKHRVKVGLLYLPFAASCILATLYLRYHYLVDVVAGALLATFALWITPKLARAWDHFRGLESE